MEKFWTGFALGFGSAIVLVVAGLLGLLVLFTGPQLAVTVDAPASVTVGEEFTVSVTASNPHDEAVELDNLDIRDRIFERFEFVAISPELEAVGGWGSQTWFYDFEIPPDSSRTIDLVLRATTAGAHVLEMDVCNAFEDCTTAVHGVDVEEDTSGD